MKLAVFGQRTDTAVAAVDPRTAAVVQILRFEFGPNRRARLAEVGWGRACPRCRSLRALPAAGGRLGAAAASAGERVNNEHQG